MPSIKIGNAAVKKLQPDVRDVFYWDTELPGFGIKVTPSGRLSYVCQYRSLGAKNPRRLKLGNHGVLTPDEARRIAKRTLAEVSTGSDPAELRSNKRRELTVSELCDRYLQEGCATKKPSTLATDHGRIERHIKPLLGHRKISEVSRGDVKQFMRDVAEGNFGSSNIVRTRGGRKVLGGRGTATRPALVSAK